MATKRPPYVRMRDRGTGMPETLVKRDRAIEQVKVLKALAAGANSPGEVAKDTGMTLAHATLLLDELFVGGSISANYRLTKRGAGRLRFPVTR